MPPLVLDMAAPLVTMTIDGQPLTLRIDPATAEHIELNGSAAQRLDLANPARRVAGRPVSRGRSRTDVGKVAVREVTAEEILVYEGRELLRTLAWSDRDPVAGADGLINPLLLPHDDVRLVHRTAAPGDVTTPMPLRWDQNRGLLAALPTSHGDIDVVFAPAAPETLATAAAASLLAQDFGGQLRGPARQRLVSHGVSRPVRDVVFARPVDVAGVRFGKVAARVFDWSGKTSIPDADLLAGEVVVAGRTDAQRQWAKLAIGSDHLGACAELRWTRTPLMMDVVCPRPAP
ncbi:hypothetical protein [Polymorphobacter fuscus]|uniref:Uncharacterized protein n=1 Tax=Sandarakinorhabdus fusca TaxID=1439888 RepID=A0A7C9KW22_9SPHN|nr:hypothetical protein [Polymorphobacter fuscus]KAB7647401.1 hypothetical protein F9290_05145 [Polymorphobacter fuscus]MQT16645.1 hypothetical protein [Polymorphobacter fuscus]NJC09370.1 hypothetical protein [Polymorphobacter fuscus]